jgi:hypothetical protein
MAEHRVAQLQTHRNNIQRYRRLLSTKLTEQERNFIDRRIAEEQALVENLPGANSHQTMSTNHVEGGSPGETATDPAVCRSVRLRA